MLKRFNTVQGQYIEKIVGQERFAYALSNMLDFYDLVEMAQCGQCPGNALMFYDLVSGEVHTPFVQEHNVIYRAPVYVEGAFYFLQGDYNRKQVTLYRYLPSDAPRVVCTLDLDEVNPYNLSIIGEAVHIVSIDEAFECYYPEQFSFPLQGNESPIFIDGNRVYLEAWVEEGWDEENDCATENYRYYHKLIVRDKEGRKLSEEIGSLYQAPDGNWWLA